jgi:hypothetical protein
MKRITIRGSRPAWGTCVPVIVPAQHQDRVNLHRRRTGLISASEGA